MIDKSEAVRDIEIESNSTFEVFHRAILDAFGFQGEEMASFYVSDQEWNYGREIPLADMGLAEDGQKPPIVMSEDDALYAFVADHDQEVVPRRRGPRQEEPQEHGTEREAALEEFAAVVRAYSLQTR